MKKLLTITLTLIISYSFAQWELYNPTPTDANLNDIFYVDDYNGWAVGEYGTILFTDNGGQNWMSQLSISGPMESTFSAVYFTDPLNGWAVGSTHIPYGGAWSSLLYHTNDGGNTWENQYSNPTENFTDVWFVNADTGWVVGSEGYYGNGIILYTEDGGMSWEEQYRKNYKYLNSVSFTDAYSGCAVGAQGLIINTSDGGETWEDQSTNDITNFTSVCFTDLNSGWAIGQMYIWPPNAKIIHTQDGGNTWEVNYEFGDYEAHDVDEIFFVDANNGWLTYRIPYGTWSIMHTSDGGETWNYQYPLISFANLPTLCFRDSITGWAVGENMIINTSDGGQNWLPQNTITNTNFNSICLVDDSNAWIAGSKYKGNYQYYNTVVYSNDAGVTWVDLGWEVGGGTIKDMYFIDENHGWSISNISHIEIGIIGRTVDGGLSWDYTAIDDMELSSVHFIDSLNGWVIGPERTIFHTTNGGIDWIDESMIDYSLTFYDVFFTDLSNGWIIGTKWDEGITYGMVYYTNDGGGSWDEQYSLENIHFVSEYFTDQNTGWIVGDNVILHTSNGGINWQQQTSGALQLNDIYFTDKNNGWAIGNNDIIYTTDGGLNWITQTSGVHNNLNCVAFIDEDNGWIAGENGVMLYTNNGGIPNDCLPEGITFTTQAQIDSFQIIYPNCTEIEGDVEINGADIVNLNGLNVLSTIGGYLNIGWTDGTSLIDLSGLESLTSIGGELLIWDELTSLNGLDNLTLIGGRFKIASNISDFTGLENLTSIGGDLFIKWSSNLSSMTGLDNLTSIGGDFYIGVNGNLTSLTGLDNLTSIEGELRLNDNLNLNSLIGLDNIESATIENMYIIYNPSLTNCEIESICNYISSPNGSIEIHDNAPGCNSQQEVEEACASSISENSTLYGIKTQPNPFTTSTTLSYELQQPDKVSLSVYNHLGQIVYQTQENQQQGSQELIWKAEGVTDGVYYYRLQVGDEVANGKMVKVR